MFSYVDDAARRMVMLEQSAPVGQLNRQDCIEQVLIALGQRPTTARDTWISRAITAYLVNCQNWTEKLQRLLLLFEAIAQQADAGPEGIAICDVFLGDIFRSRAALDEFLGMFRTLEDRLVDIVWLSRGDSEIVTRAQDKDLIKRLLEISGKFDLKAMRAALVYHIYSGLGARTEIASADLLQEVQALGRLRARLLDGDSYLGGRKTRNLLEQRNKSAGERPFDRRTSQGNSADWRANPDIAFHPSIDPLHRPASPSARSPLAYFRGPKPC